MADHRLTGRVGLLQDGVERHDPPFGQLPVGIVTLCQDVVLSLADADSCPPASFTNLSLGDMTVVLTATAHALNDFRVDARVFQALVPFVELRMLVIVGQARLS